VTAAEAFLRLLAARFERETQARRSLLA